MLHAGTLCYVKSTDCIRAAVALLLPALICLIMTFKVWWQWISESANVWTLALRLLSRKKMRVKGRNNKGDTIHHLKPWADRKVLKLWPSPSQPAAVLAHSALYWTVSIRQQTLQCDTTQWQATVFPNGKQLHTQWLLQWLLMRLIRWGNGHVIMCV